jgi:hypothetical protein
MIADTTSRVRRRPANRFSPSRCRTVGEARASVFVATAAKHQKQQRLNFLKGAFKVHADFDRMGEEKIKRLFEGEPPQSPSLPPEKH